METIIRYSTFDHLHLQSLILVSISKPNKKSCGNYIHCIFSQSLASHKCSCIRVCICVDVESRGGGGEGGGGWEWGDGRGVCDGEGLGKGMSSEYFHRAVTELIDNHTRRWCNQALTRTHTVSRYRCSEFLSLPCPSGSGAVMKK